MARELFNTVLDPRSFEAIAELAYRESGLQLVAEKSSMIQSRLRHRLRELGVDSFEKYASFVCSDDGIVERRQMISALTTNVSHFFREKHHFDILVKKAAPAFIDRIRRGAPLRLWSAGCSNGQEAYSMAISLLEAYPELSTLDFRILATDIDAQVVTFGHEGLYPERLISGVPRELLHKYFNREVTGSETEFRVSDALKQHVVFKELNLLSNWPMKHPMQAVFCRNVVIYFDAATQEKLWPRFRTTLADDGYLFLGHSERIADPKTSGFFNDGPTSYRPDTASALS